MVPRLLAHVVTSRPHIHKSALRFLHKNLSNRRSRLRLSVFCLLCPVVFCEAPAAFAQINVLTQHNDIARTGANTSETILTPSNVNTNSFGKLFSFPVDGYVYAQPLYMSGVTMGGGTPQAGTTHNVVFIATEHDSVYAFDADSNLSANAQPLWQISLLDNAHGVSSGVTATTVPSSDVSSTDLVPEIGITATGVIDPSTNTLYIVAKTKETSGTIVSYVQRLHALDITTGSEKFGGPVTLQAAIAGFGAGSASGILNWDPLWENNRTALLLLNGIVYIAFAAHGDNGPWHGWILAYNASTLSQTGSWCATPNGVGGGIWTSGSGLAADVPDPVGHPFGRILTATGNGDFDAAPPYGNSMDYGDSIIALDLTNGVPSILDDFTPYDQATMDSNDQDLGSGGVVLLPDSVGGGNHILTQVGKMGRIYVLNQDNLGGYNPNNTKDPGEAAYVGGLWGIPAYWNGLVYVWSAYDSLKAFPISNGALSSTYISNSNEIANGFSPSPSVSANGTTNGIVWSLETDNYATNGREILYAHDAANVSNLLYSSEQNVARDNPGNSVKFIVPTIANGKVYAGSESQVSVFGLLNGASQAAAPVISPASQSFSASLQVSIADSSAGATIYFTTDGSQPTTASTVYTGPFNLTSTTTVNAMAAGPGLLQSQVATAQYTTTAQVAAPTLSPAPGAYPRAQSVVISTATPNAAIFYTTDGTTPATSAGGSTSQYTGPLSVSATESIKAIATASNLSPSPVTTGLYTISSGGGSGVALVQHISNSANYTSNSVTFAGANGAGDLIIVVGGWINGGTATVSDSLGNTYYSAVGPTVNGYTAQIWYAPNIAAAAPNTNQVTVTFSNYNHSTVSVFEYSGLAASSPLDVTNANMGTGGNPNTNSVTTTQANELIIASGYALNSLTGDPNYSMEENNVYGGMDLGMEDRVVTSTGTYNATFLASSNYLWVAQIATFK